MHDYRDALLYKIERRDNFFVTCVVYLAGASAIRGDNKVSVCKSYPMKNGRKSVCGSVWCIKLILSGV